SGVAWKIPKDSVATYDLLERLAAEEDPAQIVASLRPTVPEYYGLMEQLARYRKVVAQGGWQPVPDGLPAEVGGSGAGVAALRARLIAEGDPEEVRLAQQGSGAPNVYDANIAAAVEHFQARHALQPDGRVGGS